ncbi:MAG: transketolase [Pseudonocardia sp.]|uniref:transketolase n=1 Tax=unclassified Pseudonocardia TaxID=2619320 RepID=UPI000869C0CA|nr:MULTISPECIES: transketolase [unclassified Pseudonocardia]MBN9113157.1 transketolase [Pseudonocardia sp.]ODV00926.1 MAG: transketolase [Pseudonocardia sp. SCN 73-27]
MSTAPSVPAERAGQSADTDELGVATLRFLAADAVQAANSGHPGLPLGTAPAAWTLWSRHLRHDPAAPDWADRDRFVLSAGHGSMLLYGLLNVFGYDLPIEELKNFRQLGSRTPGHPEFGHTVGVETTTGPLGQGIATAVGMALAERMLAARCNTAEHTVVDHRTWVLAGDGDLMEGISHEAASLAGKLKLGRLTVIYDDNDITIDGSANQSCADDAAARFASYGWRTLWVDDGNDIEALDRAFAEAAATEDRPTFITVKTTIGYGAPGIEGTSKAHGSPLGNETIAAMRERFGWPDEAFHVPTAVRLATAERAAEGAKARLDWTRTYDEWAAANPETAEAFTLGRIPAADKAVEALAPLADEAVAEGRAATRKASGAALNALAAVYPALVGGSADLASSTNTAIPGGEVTPDDASGRTIHFGIREHGMAAAMNGISLHGGLRVFGSTFLVFADYLRPALRLAALMKQPVVHILTHDSVHVGEDGPTHQPVEQVESLRIIPGVTVLRPADSAETAAAWGIAAATLDGPTALILSRQDLPNLGGAGLDDVRAHGARTVRTAKGGPAVVLVASGSEVSLALVAAELLADRGVEASVVSVPWRERLEASLRAGSYSLPDAPAVFIEAGVTVGWRALAGPRDAVIGIDRFGESGPGHEVADHLGLSASAVARVALATAGAEDV